MKKFLIQACSQLKIDTPGTIPALERYDGVNFRVIKKFQREQPRAAAHLTILILSAEFGLIGVDTLIPFYNRRMDLERAGELQPTILNQWHKLIGRKIFDDVFVNVGADYLPAIKCLPLPFEALYAVGAIGDRSRQLKLWLNAGCDSAF